MYVVVASFFLVHGLQWDGSESLNVTRPDRVAGMLVHKNWKLPLSLVNAFVNETAFCQHPFSSSIVVLVVVVVEEKGKNLKSGTWLFTSLLS